MECLICLYVAKNIDVQLVMGASQCDWGAWIPGKEAQGLWNERMSMKSSNYRELFAVLMDFVIQRPTEKSISSNFIRQCHHGSNDKWHGRLLRSVGHSSQDDTH